MKRILKYLTVISTFLLFVFLIFNVPSLRIAPSGAPGDYYERLDELAEHNFIIYVLDSVDYLPDKINYTTVNDLENIPRYYSIKEKYLIIDFNISSIDENGYELIEELYTVFNYRIILLNYATNRIHNLDHIIDEGDEDYDFIALDYTGDIFYSTIIISEAENNLYQDQYDIMLYILERNR